MSAPDDFARELLRWATRPGRRSTDDAAAAVVARLEQPARAKAGAVGRAWAFAGVAAAALALGLLMARQAAPPRPVTAPATTLVVPLRSGATLYIALRGTAVAAPIDLSVGSADTERER